jgi:hypothetical protein
MKPKTTLLTWILCLSLIAVVGCAPDADFKGGAAEPDTADAALDSADGADAAAGDATPDGDAAGDAGEIEEVTSAACDDDEDCALLAEKAPVPCHAPRCDADLSMCVWQAVDDGEACDDGLACTEDDACLAGFCIGQEASCDDDDPCTVDACAEPEGCFAEAMEDGAECDDGYACTIHDQCVEGECKGVVDPCDDGNPCTSGACEQGACVYTALDGEPCEDGDLCTEGEVCAGEVCTTGAFKDCASADPCRQGYCDSSTGTCGSQVLADGTPCTDGNICSLGDRCMTGACEGTDTMTCDDGNPCTADVCNPAAGCVFAPAGSGIACNTDPCVDGQTCEGGACQGGTPMACDDGDVCTVDYCDPLVGCVFMASPGLSCDDGDPCTTGDACGDDGCEPGVPVVCDDDNACTDDTCDVMTGQCSASNVMSGGCDDHNPCTGDDQCVAFMGTCAGTPMNCDDVDPCTQDFCDAATMSCVHALMADGSSCSDGSDCTTDDVCTDGVCDGAPYVCPDDGDACTIEQCEGDQGCQSVAAGVADSDCLVAGVCAEGVAATCAGGAWTCDYVGVAGYEADAEASCDGQDNDCDGSVDEGLCTACQPDERRCIGGDVWTCNDSGGGFELLEDCAAGDACVGGYCRTLDSLELMDDLDPDATRAHHRVDRGDQHLFVAAPVLVDGAPGVRLSDVSLDGPTVEHVVTLLDADARGVFLSGADVLLVVEDRSVVDAPALVLHRYSAGVPVGEPVTLSDPGATSFAPIVPDGAEILVGFVVAGEDEQVFHARRVRLLDGVVSEVVELALGADPFAWLGMTRLLTGALILGTRGLDGTQRLYRLVPGSTDVVEEAMSSDMVIHGLAAFPAASSFGVLRLSDSVGTTVALRDAENAPIQNVVPDVVLIEEGWLRLFQGEDALVLLWLDDDDGPAIAGATISDGGVSTPMSVPDNLNGLDARYSFEAGLPFMTYRSDDGRLFYQPL